MKIITKGTDDCSHKKFEMIVAGYAGCTNCKMLIELEYDERLTRGEDGNLKVEKIYKAKEDE